MLIDFTPTNTLSPIVRSTSDKRLAAFTTKSSEIYNKYSPYDGSTSGLGVKQPFVYTKLTDSNFNKNIAKYDSQALPLGSTVRDLERVGKFMASGPGLLYIGKQYLLQNTNAFNETRIYNPISLLKATAKPGSLGLIDYPQRHLETSGGILNFFLDSLKSTIGMETSAATQTTIDGTATGGKSQNISVPPYSLYAAQLGGAKYGMTRFQTGASANSRFSRIWASKTENSGGVGFLSNLGKALIGKLTQMLPSTNPYRFGTGKLEWEYRPEYPKGQDGIYYSFLNSTSGFLTINNPPPNKLFYSDKSANTTGHTAVVKSFHRYYPELTKGDPDTGELYASVDKQRDDSVGISTDVNGDSTDGGVYQSNIKSLHDRMKKTIAAYSKGAIQKKGSAERYTNVTDPNDKNLPQKSYSNYNDIPGKSGGFYNNMSKANNATTLDKRGFSKTNGDVYNTIKPSKQDGMSQDRNNIPSQLLGDENQSKDLIFFYFYDLINEIYIPFRATVSSINDQNSSELEPINYMGRADKLYLYTGFSREVSFTFTVYSNSIKELVPMWERINYLVGLTRPSKYTSPAIATGDFSQNTTGQEGRFIYPPMVTLRLGDMYYDQPCMVSSVSLNVPEDTNWESFRGDENGYSYVSSPTNEIIIEGAKSRQLPMKVDISVSLKMLEKKQSLVTNEHFGFNSPL